MSDYGLANGYYVVDRGREYDLVRPDGTIVNTYQGLSTYEVEEDMWRDMENDRNG